MQKIVKNLQKFQKNAKKLQKLHRFDPILGND